MESSFCLIWKKRCHANVSANVETRLIFVELVLFFRSYYYRVLFWCNLFDGERYN